jgi:hypothetical protein
MDGRKTGKGQFVGKVIFFVGGGRGGCSNKVVSDVVVRRR